MSQGAETEKEAGLSKCENWALALRVRKEAPAEEHGQPREAGVADDSQQGRRTSVLQPQVGEFRKPGFL